MHNRNVRFVLGLVFALLAVFTLVSIVSYLFTWADDQSLLSDDGIYSNAVTAENTGGKAGFLFANLLVSRWFGLGAFVIPFFFAGVSVYCFKKEKVRLLRLFFLSLMGCIVLSAMFSYIFSFTSAKSMFGDGAGGSYGYYVNEWLVSMTGAFGTACIILVFLVLWVMLLNHKIVDRITSLFDSLFSKRGKSDADAVPEDGGTDAGEDDVDEDGGDDEGSDDEDEDGENDDEEREMKAMNPMRKDRNWR